MERIGNVTIIRGTKEVVKHKSDDYVYVTDHEGLVHVTTYKKIFNEEATIVLTNQSCY